ncbi:MAG: NUDIX hydrolase [Rothia sp. (in: high G+C Gram-positive bacteria)]|nr:NUDIX hydrolase [Rothia sp. (in: high G+C Gram-positive bacteria)]
MPNQGMYTGALKVVPRAGTRPVSGLPGAGGSRYFKVPAALQSAARSFLESGSVSGCSLRQAASVVFVRDGAQGLETLLTYRPAASPLGVVAFPGGPVVATDADPVPWVGPAPTQWQGVLQDTDPGITHAAVVAAIREAFEETGVLLAGANDMSTVELTDGLDQMEARQLIADGAKTMSEYLVKRGLKLRTDLLRPLARWQSPDFRHQRYDIRYFACAVPVGQKFTLLKGRGVWGEWVNVRELLATAGQSWLGDRIGVAETRGLTLEELLTPGVLCILEGMAKPSTAVSFLAQKRKVEVKKAEIVEVDGEYMLTFTSPSTPGTWEKCATKLYGATREMQ